MILTMYMFLVFNLCQFDYYVLQHVPTWVYPYWYPLCLLDLIFSFLVLRNFQLLSLQIFSSVLSLFSFWHPYNANGVFNIQDVSYAVFVFSYIYIYICKLVHWLHWVLVAAWWALHCHPRQLSSCGTWA